MNMFGNVSEMTNIKEIAIGESFADTSDVTSFDKEIKYEQPENWIGFRCVYVKIQTEINNFSFNQVDNKAM